MQIYLIDITSISDSDFEKCYSLCPEYRKKKIDSKLLRKDKLRSLGGEILLMHGLSRLGITDYEIHLTENGKPYLKNAPVFFSISHSGNVVVCAFSTVETGVDVQVRKNIPFSVASRFFSEGEKEENAISIWTRKEALAKATGLGLSREILNTAIWGESVLFHGQLYHFKTTEYENHVLSVCSQSPISDITIEHIYTKNGSL
ncbi:MAG: 4'-phosphopantetheinyl transferase superfamily protein [Oscillospiraceae bacterium]|nr:4'-phosphopantetheinyl transferase superfamily protein [Oscillospiraceae bacterium]